MSKTLTNIMTVFKVVRIIAKVVFILCLVGAVGCLVALFTLSALNSLLPATAAPHATFPSCFVGLAVCAGEAVLAYLAERYFGHVLDAGTPFTEEGAKECFRLGLASIITSVAVSVVSGIAMGLYLVISAVAAEEIDVDVSISLGTGLFFLFLSLILKYGAELQVKADGRGEEACATDESTSHTEML